MAMFWRKKAVKSQLLLQELSTISVYVWEARNRNSWNVPEQTQSHGIEDYLNAEAYQWVASSHPYGIQSGIKTASNNYKFKWMYFPVNFCLTVLSQIFHLNQVNTCRCLILWRMLYLYSILSFKFKKWSFILILACKRCSFFVNGDSLLINT